MGKGRTPTITRTCEKCGTLFHPWHLRRPNRFCSRACAPRGRQPTLQAKPCSKCGVIFCPDSVKRAYCSRECYRAVTGGRSVNVKGYALIYMPSHPRAYKLGQMLEHIVVMEQTLGRYLYPYETVHHINGQKDDNRPENLQVRNGRHGKGWINVCADCGSHNIIHEALAVVSP